MAGIRFEAKRTAKFRDGDGKRIPNSRQPVQFIERQTQASQRLTLGLRRVAVAAWLP